VGDHEGGCISWASGCGTDRAEPPCRGMRYRMRRNFAAEGMAEEDGPRRSGSCISLASMIRVPRHQRSRTLHALGTSELGQQARKTSAQNHNSAGRGTRST